MNPPFAERHHCNPGGQGYSVMSVRKIGQLPLTGDYTQNLDNECNGDLSPVETIGGGLDYFRLADED
jgi:hypothetical protein